MRQVARCGPVSGSTGPGLADTLSGPATLWHSGVSDGAGAGMAELGLVLGLVALVIAWRAQNHASRLEGQLNALIQARGAAPPQVEPAEADPAADPDDTPPPKAPAPRTGWGPPRATQVPQAPQAPRAPSALAAWLRDNWIYPAAGAALVLAGVFLVQYAVDKGLLTPQARVVLALALGAALTLGGEWLRRRPIAGPILPATLAGAGLVIAMAAVLAALHLYAMIGAAAALVALAILSLLTLALGWWHGPMLAALGLIAGSAAPFALGGGGTPPDAILGYFVLLAVAGMAIDGLRRWGWVSWLAVALPMAAMVLWRLAGAGEGALALAVILTAAAAMALPMGRIAPLATGARAWSRGGPFPGVRASFLASLIAAAALALLAPGWAGPLGLAALAGLIAVWAQRAPALADQMALPVLAFPAWVVWQGMAGGPILAAFLTPLPHESGWSWQATVVLALSLAAGLAFLWRGERDAPGPHAPWTLAGLILPGATLAALETAWTPGLILGPLPWAAQAMGLAALATGLALRYAARDAGQGPRLGAATAMAFALIALGLMLVLGAAALSVALAILMAGAAAMDRRFDIPALGLFQVLAGASLLWRLILDPGLEWHLSAILGGGPWEAVISALATVAGPLAALALGRGLPPVPLRRWTQGIVETTLVVGAAVGAAVLIARILPDRLSTAAYLGAQAVALIALAWAQVRRRAGGWAVWLHSALAWVMGLGAGLCLAVSLTLALPLLDGFLFDRRIVGWPILNDLILAYLLPGATLIWLARWRWLVIFGWALVALWAGLAIRHLWQGPDLIWTRGVAEGELYAYTFALLAAGAGLLGRAVWAGRADLRRLGLALIGLAAAKAFLIDAAGLGGLVRVGAFLALGLSLAALAWVNGWAVARERGGAQDGPVHPNIR